MRRPAILWLVLSAVVFAFFFLGMDHSNERLVSELKSDVADSAKEISLCELGVTSVSDPCWQLPETAELVRLLENAQKAQPPSHGVRQRSYLLKITKASRDGIDTVVCFVLGEYAGFENDLYVFRVHGDENCSDGTLKYQAGSAKIHNTLPTRKGKKLKQPGVTH